MANGLPQYLIGKDIVVQAEGLTISALGAITPATAITFNGQLDDAGFSTQFSYDTEQISPLDCPQRNSVDITSGASFALSEILTAEGVSGTTVGVRRVNLLDNLVRSYRNIRFTFLWKDHSSPTPGTIRKEVVYAKWTQWNPNYRKGKCVGQATFETIAIADGSGGWIANPQLSDS